MDLKFTQEQEAYRLEAREWIQRNVPQGWEKLIEEDYEALTRLQLEWEKKLYQAGYAGISWPKKYGGQGLTFVEEFIFNEEAGLAGAPEGLNIAGKGLLGPTMLALGTEEQKKRFIPPLLKCDEIWCQGYSEPNAGSDLANIATRAVLDGDEWVINGQKIWTSFAQYAQWGFVLARTNPDAPKHKGITYFLVPMDSPGITIQPLQQINRKKKFNEVFFDNVRIPKDSYLGEVNDGWKVAMTTLSFERGTALPLKQTQFIKELLDLVRLSKDLSTSMGEPVIKDSYYRQKLSQSYMDFTILRYHALNTISQLIHKGNLGPEASLLKLYYSETHQKFGDLTMEVLSQLAPYWGKTGVAQGKFQQVFLDSRAETIFGGTSQIQKNIIAERVLGMPK